MGTTSMDKNQLSLLLRLAMNKVEFREISCPNVIGADA